METDVRVVDLNVTGFPVAWVDNETILLRVDTGQSWRRQDGSLSAVNRLAAYNYKTRVQQQRTGVYMPTYGFKTFGAHIRRPTTVCTSLYAT